eukprot:TRINITY_DN6401_c0_g1_i1.p1 TRINITY_DN6401_c0_g1~~TRINITY_DN6401_c0_g1_i1.p1  ORF type:complete len:1026 (-),score=180.05 TRINITY_DN6401_c0_g1_i1:24-2777(-)
MMQTFVVKCVLYASLSSINRFVSASVTEENNSYIRRFVLERILYTEAEAIQQMSLQPDFDYKISKDISSTLDFFNIYLPSLLSGLGAFIIDGNRLLRRKLDFLVILYPIITHMIQRAGRWAEYHYVTKGRKKESKKNSLQFDKCTSDALAHLVDLQLNNMQQFQLKTFDKTANRELSNKYGYSEVFYQSFHTLQDMSFLGYVLEIFCVHKIMARQSMDYHQYSKIQQETEHVVQIGRRVIQVAQHSRCLFGGQKLLKLLAMPNFLGEVKDNPAIQLTKLESLVLDNVSYTYPGMTDPTLDLSNGVIKFQSKVTYAIVGGDMLGTSLANLLTKLYLPQQGVITVNGINYADIPRVQLRNFINYVPEKPFMIDGTIRDNLLLVSPLASEETLVQAALCAGVHIFLRLHGASEPIPGAAPIDVLRESKHHKRRELKKKKKTSNKKEKEEEEKLKTGLPRNESFGDSKFLVTPHLNVYKDSTSSHFPLNIPEEDDHILPSYSSSSDDDEKEEELSDRRTPDFFRRREAANSPRILPHFWAQKMEGEKKSQKAENSETPLQVRISRTLPVLRSPRSLADSEDSRSASTARAGSRTASRESVRPTDAENMYFNMDHEAESSCAADPEHLYFNIDREGRSSSSEEESNEGLEDPIITPHSTQDEMKDVLDTVVNAATISRGLAQAIGLARVFLRPEAKIVILNESLKFLDELTLRQVVFPNIWAFVNTNDICLIVISKTYSIIREVDCILVFDRTRGTVAHAGPHQVLLDQRARLFMQFMFPWTVTDLFDEQGGLSREASRERRSSQDPVVSSEGAVRSEPKAARREHKNQKDRRAADDSEYLSPLSHSLATSGRRWKSMADFSQVEEQEELSSSRGSQPFSTFAPHFHSKSFSDFSKITSPAYQRKSKRHISHKKKLTSTDSK